MIMDKYNRVDYADVLSNNLSRLQKHLVVPTWIGIGGGILFGSVRNSVSIQ
jgi:hypothetical protein